MSAIESITTEIPQSMDTTLYSRICQKICYGSLAIGGSILSYMLIGIKDSGDVHCATIPVIVTTIFVALTIEPDLVKFGK